jgi:ABC-2 type transport system permease protein
VTRLVGAEFFKLRTTRTFYGLVGGSLGLVLLIVILVTALADFGPQDQPLEDMLSVTGFVQAFALVIGILAVTTEFRHGTVTPSLLVAPNRVALTLAKLIASVLTGLVLGLVATGLVALIVKGIGGARDLDTSGDVLTIIVGGTLATGLFAALGVGIGSILRNQVGAIIGSLVYLFVLESLLTLIPGVDDVITKYGLGGVSGALFGAADSGDQLGQVTGGLLFAAYTAVFVIVGIFVMQRRDVTA